MVLLVAGAWVQVQERTAFALLGREQSKPYPVDEDGLDGEADPGEVLGKELDLVCIVAAPFYQEVLTD